MNAGKAFGVAVIGDVLDINTWSNIPYYFFTAGRDAGLFSQPWRVDVSRLKFPRISWNARQVLLGRGSGGFQYSQEFLDECERQVPAEYFSSTIISFNQVFPRASTVRAHGGEIYYYIDTTLYDLFKEKSYSLQVPEKMKQSAIEQERSNYSGAVAVVSMGRWVHDSLSKIYGLPPTSIKHILPGANIVFPGGNAIKPFRGGAGIDRPLILGFIGKDWKRKGLDFLLAVRDCLEALGVKATVRAIGNAPDEFKHRDGFEHTGFINKHNEAARFIESVSSCDFGCLFSTAEALGISTLEFLRLGVPVMGFNRQGLIDTLMDGASLKFEPGESEQGVADAIATVVRDNGRLSSLKQIAIQVSELADWKTTISKWEHLLKK